MDAETWKIAKAILKGKQEEDYIVLINNNQISLQDYLSQDHYSKSILLPEISNASTLISGSFDGTNSLPINAYALQQSELYSFADEIKKDKKLLEEQEKNQIISEFNKYTFSNTPSLKHDYFTALGAAQYIIGNLNPIHEKNYKPERIKKHSEYLMQLIDNIIRINPENLDEKYDEQTFGEAINSRNTMLKNKIYNGNQDKEKIFVVSALLSNVLEQFGHNLRQKQKSNGNIYQPSDEVINYLNNNPQNLMM